MKKILLCYFLVFFPFSTMAHQRSKMIPYLGFAVNNTKIRLNDSIRDDYPHVRSNMPGARVFGGIRFLRQLLAFEMGLEAISTFKLGENINRQGGTQIKLNNTTIDVLAFVPLHQGIYIFGGMGLGHPRARITSIRSQSKTSFRWTTGFDFNIDYYLSGRLYYAYQHTSKSIMPIKRFNQLGGALIYRFR